MPTTRVSAELDVPEHAGISYLPDGVLHKPLLYWRQQLSEVENVVPLLNSAARRDSMMHQRIWCPNPVCPQPEAVQNVNVVAQSRYALHQSPVAWQLLPPEAPVSRQRPGWALGARGFFYLFVLGGSAVALIPLKVLVGHIQLTPDLVSKLAPTFFLGMVAVASLVLYIAEWRRQPARYERNYERYLRARARWDQLYYCNGCGSVFHPHEPGRFVPAAHMKDLLA